MTTLAEPEFLSLRRAAAVAEADGLDLPVFKGEAGWEFTPLKGFDVAAYPAAPGGAEDAAEHVLDLDLDAAVRVSADEAVSEGPVVLPLAVAAERHPDIVERYLGTVVTAALAADGRERRALERRRVRLRPARRARRGADRPVDRPRAGRQRAAPSRARRPRGGRAGRGLAPVAVRRTARPRASSTASPSSSSARTRGCASSTRRRCPRRRGSSARSARSSSATGRSTGSRSGSAPATARSSSRRSSPAPARTPRSPARTPRAAASTWTSTRCRSTPRPTRRPTSPSAASSTAGRARSGAA